jgi:GTP-binding protein HflX
VVDIAHPGFEEQIEVVNKTLADIGASDKPMIYLFNKIDAFTHVEKEEDDLTPSSRENKSLDEWMNSWMAKESGNAVFISAKQRINIPNFKRVLYEEVKKIHVTRFPFNDFLYPNFED